MTDVIFPLPDNVGGDEFNRPILVFFFFSSTCFFSLFLLLCLSSPPSSSLLLCLFILLFSFSFCLLLLFLCILFLSSTYLMFLSCLSCVLCVSSFSFSSSSSFCVIHQCDSSLFFFSCFPFSAHLCCPFLSSSPLKFLAHSHAITNIGHKFHKYLQAKLVEREWEWETTNVKK